MVRYCDSCGSPIAVKASFCAVCGTKAPDPSDVEGSAMKADTAQAEAVISEDTATSSPTVEAVLPESSAVSEGVTAVAVEETAVIPDTSESTIFCANCGKELVSSAKFCSGCGAKTSEPTVSSDAYSSTFADQSFANPEVQPGRKASAIIIPLILIVLILAVVTFDVLVFTGFIGGSKGDVEAHRSATTASVILVDDLA